jgi:alpha-D-xyloside xylohydrolase
MNRRVLAAAWLLPSLALLLPLRLPAATAAASESSAPATIEQRPDGIIISHGGLLLDLEVRADNVIRVAASPNRAFFSAGSLDVLPQSGVTPKWAFSQTADAATLTTDRLRVSVDLASGAVSFFDAAGAAILAEVPGSRALDAADVQGEHTAHVQQQWRQQDESLYGLGQHQLGIVDLKGYDLDLWQRNTNVVVPFLVSSRGYGILWDNLSYTRFGDLRDFAAIPADCLVDASGQPGGLTTGTFTAASPDTLQNPATTANIVRGRGGRSARGAGGPPTTRWVGEVVAPTTGDYQFQTYSNGGIKMWLDGTLVIDHWRQSWLTEYDQVKIHLEQGRHYALKLESGGEQVSTMNLTWKTPPASADTSLWSEVGDGEDYYFVYGPELDKVVAGYRLLTGQATMMPQWAFGLWQSRQRYETAQESLDVVKEFRRREIPFDNIVQDWMYWPENAWGSHQFDPARFPDPEAWIKSIHDLHAHLMISVWGKFYPTTDNAKAMQAAGFLYQPTLTENTHDWVGRGGYNYTFYDAFNPAARQLFWQQMNTGLFSKHVDAWWMDATEPDVVQPSPPTIEKQKHFIGTTAAGSASRVLNGYALMNSEGIYEGQRAAAPDQRVFILTRSGYAGQQRYGAVTWSGDITSTWTALAKQIPAGLGFSLSGVPYWTTDTGGYTMETRFSAKNPTPANLDEWRELNARWFEYSTFTPVLRVHGELRQREMWNIGDETTPVYQAELKFDQLRYALFPYIYSLAGDVAQNAGTMMRPLVMDFPQDALAREQNDEYQFGPAFLVAPVTRYQARSRAVYLPAGTAWYDFWTGQTKPGGQTVDTPAPYDAMPLYVRPGSIIPYGPAEQYVAEKPADTVTLWIYAGADGKFTLYEDDGLTYAYEKGAFSQIPIEWKDATRTLTLGPRSGSFTGMLNDRIFNLVLVSANQPLGYSATPKINLSVQYHGDAVAVPVPAGM